jgi:pimeloyl-ACP methyl ester carboxylesterase
MLAKNARVIAVDLPGFGETPLAGRRGSIETHQKTLHSVLTGFLKEPAHVVGHSMGGLVALLEADRSPDTVEALVLVAPAVPRPPHARLDDDIAGLFASFMVPGLGRHMLAARWHRIGARGRVEEMLRVCCVNPSGINPDVIEALVEEAALVEATPGSVDAYLASVRSSIGYMSRRKRMYDLLGRVTAPTMLVHGREDRLIPLAYATAVTRRRRDWRLLVLPDAGHIPQLETPDLFAEKVSRWIFTYRAR